MVDAMSGKGESVYGKTWAAEVYEIVEARDF